MGIKFGEIDSSQILENEYRISVLEGILEFLVIHNRSITGPTLEQIMEIRKKVVENLQKKYPNSGIALKE